MRLVLLKKLSRDRVLTNLVTSGIVDPTIKIWYDIYLEWDKMNKVTKKSKTDIIQATADRFSVSSRTVYKAIRFVKS